MAQRSGPGDQRGDGEIRRRADKAAKEVQKAKAVARISVPYCSGSHRLKIAKLPPDKPRKNSIVMKGVQPVGQIERPAERQRDGHHHADEIARQGSSAGRYRSASFGASRQPRMVPTESMRGAQRRHLRAVGGDMPAVFARQEIAVGS